jgi:hypothetical protein
MKFKLLFRFYYFFRIRWKPIKNEEERRKFGAKRISDEEVTSKTVKSGNRVSTCGQQKISCKSQTDKRF